MLARGELDLHTHANPPPDSRNDADDDTAEALAAFGLVLEDDLERPREQIFWLWPEHVRTLEVWLACATQWRVGPHGATGLDYAGIEAMFRIRRLADAQDAPELFHELQLMERATLKEWARQRASQRKR